VRGFKSLWAHHSHFGLPLFCWDYADEGIKGGPAVCSACHGLRLALTGFVTVARVERLRKAAA
jgi:hypothetical protein